MRLAKLLFVISPQRAFRHPAGGGGVRLTIATASGTRVVSLFDGKPKMLVSRRRIGVRTLRGLRVIPGLMRTSGEWLYFFQCSL
jgi:hypothetical protein